MCHKIKEGAIFISDAHESDIRDGFYNFLLLLEKEEIATPQLFLMGDMFDLLVGKVENCVKKYEKYINLLEKLAQKFEIYYFEGNHDFCLEDIFLHVKVIPISKQPMLFSFEDDTHCLLSHGDKYGGLFHSLFTRVIRSKGILKLLNLYDKLVKYKLSNKIERDLLHKNICQKIENFQQIIEDKINQYNVQNCNYIVEGHYHQNQQFQVKEINYINFSSFACNQSYFIVELSQGAKFAQKKLRGCNV